MSLATTAISFDSESESANVEVVGGCVFLSLALFRFAGTFTKTEHLPCTGFLLVPFLGCAKVQSWASTATTTAATAASLRGVVISLIERGLIAFGSNNGSLRKRKGKTTTTTGKPSAQIETLRQLAVMCEPVCM